VFDWSPAAAIAYISARSHTLIPGAAISRYKRAIDLAREQGSRWFELRTGTSLARLLSERGQRIEANDVLVNIYQTFDARCTRPDITDARLLIEAIQ